MMSKPNYIDIKEDIPNEIEHIPRWAIKSHLDKEKNGTVIDPFCGSGTTLVEGMLEGHNVVGIDIDPLSALISKVKTTSVDIFKLNEISRWLVKSIKRRKKGAFKPECETIEHWFDKQTTDKLSLIRTLINEIPERFGRSNKIKDIQDLLLVCFSSIIRRVSKADNESQKTYVSHTKVKEPEEPIDLFISKIDFFKERIKEFSETVNPKLRNRILCSSNTDSLDVKLKGQKIDLVITSPPYIKAIDYIYNQMVELFWVGDIFGLQTQTKQNKKKRHYIGTKHIHKIEFAKYNPLNYSLGIKKLDYKIKEVFTKDKKNGHKHAYVTFKYFMEMEKHFKEVSKFLDKGLHYIIIVGNSTVSNVLFNTADFLVEISERNGFKLENRWGYKIKNRYMRFDRKGRGGIIEIDWVLDLIRK
jgi:DNA modification methylase